MLYNFYSFQDNVQLYLYLKTYRVKAIYDSIKEKTDKFGIEFIDTFLAELFYSKATSLNEYKITSSIIDIIYNLQNNDEIFYPSVQHRRGYDFTIKAESFDNLLKVEKCLKLKITTKINFGIYKYNVLDYSKNIEPDGTIIWQNNI